MFVGPWAVVEGLRAVAAEDRCWAMVDTDENWVVAEESVIEMPLVANMATMMAESFSSSSITAEIIRE